MKIKELYNLLPWYYRQFTAPFWKSKYGQYLCRHRQYTWWGGSDYRIILTNEKRKLTKVCGQCNKILETQWQ